MGAPGPDLTGASRLEYPSRCAGVAELVDARVSKTRSFQECRFEPDRPHHQSFGPSSGYVSETGPPPARRRL